MCASTEFIPKQMALDALDEGYSALSDPGTARVIVISL